MKELEEKMKKDALALLASLVPVVGVEEGDEDYWKPQTPEDVLGTTIGQAKYFTQEHSLDKTTKENNRVLVGGLVQAINFTTAIVKGLCGSGYTREQVWSVMPGYVMEDKQSGGLLCVSEKINNEVVSMAFGLFREMKGDAK